MKKILSIVSMLGLATLAACGNGNLAESCSAATCASGANVQVCVGAGIASVGVTYKFPGGDSCSCAAGLVGGQPCNDCTAKFNMYCPAPVADFGVAPAGDMAAAAGADLSAPVNQMCNGGDLCALANQLGGKCGSCDCGGRTVDQARCQMVKNGACSSADDQTKLCNYMTCLIAGPNCVAGMELQFFQADAACLNIYATISQACLAAIAQK